MNNANTVLPVLSVAVAICSFGISIMTLWLTLLRKGKLKMTRPTLIAFAFDNNNGSLIPKVFFRSLLYSTSKRPQIIESMFVKISTEKSIQIFSFWGYGNKEILLGSGMCVPFEGVESYHHFVLPKESASYEFAVGENKLEVFADIANKKNSKLLYSIKLILTDDIAESLNKKHNGAGFDWMSDAKRYKSYIMEKPLKAESANITVPTVIGLLNRKL